MKGGTSLWHIPKNFKKTSAPVMSSYLPANWCLLSRWELHREKVAVNPIVDRLAPKNDSIRYVSFFSGGDKRLYCLKEHSFLYGWKWVS